MKKVEKEIKILKVIKIANIEILINIRKQCYQKYYKIIENIK